MPKEYTLKPLAYSFGALEPYIDARTMEIHHDKHYLGYINNLNAALEKHPALFEKSLEDILRNLDDIPEDIRTAVRNNGGGTYNHAMFWTLMKPQGGGIPRGKIADALKKYFDTFENFQALFNAAAKMRFGSGWAWLNVTPDGQLTISSTANQDCPLSQGLTPIFGLDVWEHAYYLKYQNRRPDYITAWWHVVNWEQVEENFRAAIK
ncbi:MAG: superoxide dismutase [Candidatus Babeliales bacterium]